MSIDEGYRKRHVDFCVCDYGRETGGIRQVCVDSAEASLEFFPSAYAAAENEYAVAGGDDDEAFLVVQPRDVLVDAECL